MPNMVIDYKRLHLTRMNMLWFLPSLKDDELFEFSVKRALDRMSVGIIWKKHHLQFTKRMRILIVCEHYDLRFV